MINWPAPHRILRVRRTRRRLLLPLVAVSAMLMALIMAGPPADADTTGTTNPGCSEVNTANFSPGCLPPPLLTLSGLYAATPAQASSLLDLEYQAITNTIEDHGLGGDDGSAVLGWARPDAEAELFALIVQAIDTPAASQTPDQQNAVAWVQAIEQRQAEVAAQDAGLEYVKWAGLDQATYSSLIGANASESDFQSFLSGPAEPYENGGSGGYCAYQPPSPDQSEYTAPTTCSANGGGIGGLLGGPPAPSYDQFLAWVRRTRPTRCSPPPRPWRKAVKSQLACTSAALLWAPRWPASRSVPAWPPRSWDRRWRRPCCPTPPQRSRTWLT